jgi:hypothetical protein
MRHHLSHSLAGGLGGREMNCVIEAYFASRCAFGFASGSASYTVVSSGVLLINVFIIIICVAADRRITFVNLLTPGT